MSLSQFVIRYISKVFSHAILNVCYVYSKIRNNTLRQSHTNSRLIKYGQSDRIRMLSCGSDVLNE